MINNERLVKTFLELVKIDSPSGEEDAIAKELSRRITDLGAIVQTDTYGNVLGKIPGKGHPYMLNAHMDTVEPGRGINPQINGDKITSDGSTVLGGDPKAGVVAIIEAITSLKEDNKPHKTIEVIFTRSEETGLLGAVNLDYSLVTAKQGVTFDGEYGVENIDLSAPGYYQLNATITGKAAHAGAEPEKGISSIKIASEIISQLPLGRVDKETTCNIGLISGGSARNAIPEVTQIKGELRSRDIEKLEKLAGQFKGIFSTVIKQHPHASLDLKLVLEFGPYRFDKTHPVVQQITKVFSGLGIIPQFHDSGGGTDVNIFHTYGIEAIVVGTGDYEAHTKREYVLISEMEKAAQFCEKLISL